MKKNPSLEIPTNLTISTNNSTTMRNKRLHIKSDSSSLKDVFNSISDVFDNKELFFKIKEMPNSKIRVKMIDKIIKRREEIKKMEEMSNISKYNSLLNKIKDKFVQNLQTRRLFSDEKSIQNVIRKSNFNQVFSDKNLSLTSRRESILSNVNEKKSIDLNTNIRKSNLFDLILKWQKQSINTPKIIDVNKPKNFLEEKKEKIESVRLKKEKLKELKNMRYYSVEIEKEIGNIIKEKNIKNIINVPIDKKNFIAYKVDRNVASNLCEEFGVKKIDYKLKNKGIDRNFSLKTKKIESNRKLENFCQNCHYESNYKKHSLTRREK